MSKKNKTKLKANNPIVETDSPVKKLIMIFGAVTIIFICFYVITILVTKKDEVPTATEEDAVKIQYDNILVGSIFSQQGNEYYVLVTKEDDLDTPLYQAYASTYSNKKDALKFYYADLSSGFNKDYFAEASNVMAEKIKDIRFSDTTLLYIKDDKIVNYYEGKSNIITFLKTKIS